MELRQLRYFVRIVELGSVSRAAKDLFIAQPALSAQIANLENELGVRLLARSVRGVTPTASGEALYLHAGTVLRQIERLRHEVSRTGQAPGGPVSVGVPTSAANVLAGPLIAEVQQRYPDVRLRIVESLSGHLQELVATGRLEMSLLFEPAAGQALPPRGNAVLANLQWVPLLEEGLYLLCTPDGDAEKDSPVTLAEAARMRLVLPGRANITRRIIEQAFDEAGLQTNVIAELDSLSTIQSIVQSGQAGTILSLSSLVGPGVGEELSMRPISDAPLARRLSLCMSDIVGLGAAAESVAALIPQVTRQLVEAGRWAGARMADEAVHRDEVCPQREAV